MKNCKIEINFEDGAMSSHFEGSTADLVAGCVSIVSGMSRALKDAHSGEFAKMMFEAYVQSGKCFDESNFETEEFKTREELEERLKKEHEEAEKKEEEDKAKEKLGQIVKMLLDIEIGDK